ncbi:hypothetical protein SAMN05216201_109188 [Pseudomonas linyingensis]|uniref:Uncharacterized protein n=1 Tax=Pseudomonas linyingensis TaxID=915471 RepID=A0A1H6ZJF0_9PSED|nr:hypothetical protein SAMN05216201_109188 [Pseudomonas linyingensis]
MWCYYRCFSEAQQVGSLPPVLVFGSGEIGLPDTGKGSGKDTLRSQLDALLDCVREGEGEGEGTPWWCTAWIASLVTWMICVA